MILLNATILKSPVREIFVGRPPGLLTQEASRIFGGGAQWTKSANAGQDCPFNAISKCMKALRFLQSVQFNYLAFVPRWRRSAIGSHRTDVADKPSSARKSTPWHDPNKHVCQSYSILGRALQLLSLGTWRNLQRYIHFYMTVDTTGHDAHQKSCYRRTLHGKGASSWLDGKKPAITLAVRSVGVRCSICSVGSNSIHWMESGQFGPRG